MSTVSWVPDRLLRALLIWTSLTTVIFWLPAVRSVLDGPTYEWGFFGFSGKGLAGDFWFPLLATALALLLQFLGWRGARLPFHVLLTGWHLLIASGAIALTARNPEDFRFRGDTLGVDVSLAVIGPLFFSVWAALALFWVVRDLRRRRTREAPSWSPANTRWAIGLAALLPVQLALLRLGPPHGLSDQVGVLLTIAQWLLVGAALKPRVRGSEIIRR